MDKDGIIKIKEIDEASLQSEIIKSLLSSVKRWKGSAPTLPKARILPEEIPRCLPHISVIERRDSGVKRLYIRLTGEEIENRTLGYMSGNYVEDITPAFYTKSMQENYHTALDEGKIKIQHLTWHYKGLILPLERLIVPLLIRDSKIANGLLIATERDKETIAYMRDEERRFDEE